MNSKIFISALILSVLTGCDKEPPPERPEPEPEVFTCVDVATKVLLRCAHISDEPCDGLYDSVYRSCRTEIELGNDVRVADGSIRIGWVIAPKHLG